MDDTYDPAQIGALDQGHKVIVVAVSIALVILFLTWAIQERAAPQKLKLRLPPGPRGLPVLGALPYLGGSPHRALHKLSLSHGPVMFMYLGSLPTVVVCNADMAKEMYKTNDQALASRPIWSIPTSLLYNQKDISFAEYGSDWRQLRKFVTLELFTMSRINHFQDKREKEVHAMVQSILKESQKGNAVRMDTFFGNLTMNFMTQIMWNKSYCGSSAISRVDGEEDRFADIIRDFFSVLVSKNIFDFLPPSWSFLRSIQGLDKRAASVHQRLDKFLSDIVSEHKQRRSFLTKAEESPNDTDDFVDVLLKRLMHSQEDERISEDSLKAILTDALMAGTKTTAFTLEWALAELVRHPYMMSRAQDELSSVVGSDRLVNGRDIPNLKYLNAVLRETLRMHPPAPLAIPHSSIADSRIGGYHVPAGCLVFANLWAINRDPAMWERPSEFDPERFLDKGAGAAVDWKGQDFQFIPFGSGRRMCPAVDLASAILHLALAQVVHSMNCSLPGNQKPENLDMAESSGFEAHKAIPLTLLAEPRLSSNVIFSEFS